MILFGSLLGFFLVVGSMGAAAASAISAVIRDVPPDAGEKKLRLVFPVVFLAVSVFFLVNPHRDVFSGLDAAKYRMLAEAFESGRGFHDPDSVFGEVPADVRPFFLFRDLTHQQYRTTRDGIFQLDDLSGMKTSPFFIPALPLAASGFAAVGFSRDLFVPLMGLLWIASVFAVASIHGGRAGVFIAVSMLFATAWPAWFLRGFHSECVGGLIVATVISASLTGEMSRKRDALFGFMLGLSLAFHLTMTVMALPVALFLVLRSGKWDKTFALVLGGMAGTLPLLLINAFVCKPYGDFLDFNSLKAMCASVREIRAVVAVLSAAAVCGVGVVALAHVRKVRDASTSDTGRRVVSAACIAVCAAGAAMPFAAGGALLEGWRTTFSGISLLAVYIFAAAVLCLFVRRGTSSERFLFTSLFVFALVFVYIKGVEVPAGIWSQRRFGPVVFCMTSLLVVPLSKGMRDAAARNRKLACVLAFPMLLAPVLLMMAWPVAYFTANNKGADKLVEAMKGDIAHAGADALTVFDYYPHSVPYQFSQTASVFGLAESVAKVQGHGPVMKWLAEEAGIRPVRIVTSHAFPATLVEDGVMLKLVGFHQATIRATATKAFFPIERRDPKVVNAVYDVMPIVESNRLEAVQTKTMDGGPLGLRPPWGRVVKNGMWSQEGSGIVGTLPRPGEKVEIKVTASWYPPDGNWTNQVIVVTPPFKGNPLEMNVQSGWTCIRTDTIDRWADDTEARGQTGVYRIHAKTPYHPEKFGISGFGEGLGAVIESVSIRVLKSTLKVTRKFVPPVLEAPLVQRKTDKPPRNIILVIGDGMGQGAYDLASLWTHGETNRLVMQQLPVAGLCKTFSKSSSVTDSAAAGTAIACGMKVNNSNIGVTAEGQRLKSVAEAARGLGKSVALITSDSLSGATPAVFFAHQTARGMAPEIVADAAACGFEILIGNAGTRGLFTQNGQLPDQRDLQKEMEARGYRFISTPEAFADVSGDAKVLGQIESRIFTENDAALSVFSKTAIDRLEKDADGFFMMVESTYPDKGGHANDPTVAAMGTIHADWVAKVAVEYAAARGDTLVICTADHETGSLSVKRGLEGGSDLDIAYGGTAHSSAKVPIYSFGPGAELFRCEIDNTEIARNIAKLWGFEISVVGSPEAK